MARYLLAVCFYWLLWPQPALADRANIVVDGKEAFQVRAQMIRSARSEILLSTFIIEEDPWTFRLLGLIYKAADRGCRVKILLDAITHRLSHATVAALREHPNIDLRVYHRFNVFRLGKAFRRLHDKLIVVDGQQLLTGGRNISQKYFGHTKGRYFNDLDIWVEGVAANEAQIYFHEIWASAHVADPHLYSFSPDELERICIHEEDEFQCEAEKEYVIKRTTELKEKLQSLGSKMGSAPLPKALSWEASDVISRETHFLFDPPHTAKNGDGIRAQIFEIVRQNTTRSLVIMSPYVILTELSLELLNELTERDIEITIITNSVHATDNLFAQAGYRKWRNHLLNLGIELWEYRGPDTLHGKALIIDDELTLVGSYNFDPRSENLNRELAVVVRNRQLAATLLGTMQEHMQNADRVESQERPGGWRGLAVKFLRVFVPLYEDQL